MAVRLSQRRKFFILLFLSLSVLAWIATFADETVKSIQFAFTTEQNYNKEDIPRNEINIRSMIDHLVALPPKVDCPQEPPLLQGALKMSFNSSLTLRDVAHDNKEVVKGQYKPSRCTARQSVAIIIPFRKRDKHLLYLLNHLHPFLQRQLLHYKIYVVTQAGNSTFNRAKLLNAGFLEARKDFSWDCFIFHDVDLLPENDHNIYMCIQNHPKHFAVCRNSTGYKLNYPGYFGGVTGLTKDQFESVNGFSNGYWGWGSEDDDLLARVRLQNMTIVRPPCDIAHYSMVFHTRDIGNQENKNRRKLLKQAPHVWRNNGLNSCSYKILSVEKHALYVNTTVDIGEPPSNQTFLR